MASHASTNGAAAAGAAAGGTALDLLLSHTKIDMDGLDAAVAERYNARAGGLTTPGGGDAARHFFFGDMTGNQFITLAAVQAMPAPQREALLRESKQLAQQLVQSGETAFKIEETEQEQLLGVASDVVTVRLALGVSTALSSSSILHAQVFPSMIPSASQTAAHARRLVRLFSQLSPGGSVDKSRVCIKVPATVVGLQACAALREQDGIQTLATTTFCIEQGLAAAESAGCRAISPYVHPLEAHFYMAEDVPEGPGHRLLAHTAKAAIPMVRALQAELRARSAATRLVGASFIDPSEPLALAGIDGVTLFPGVVDALDRPATDADRALVDESLKAINAKVAEPVTKTDWLHGDGLKRLEAALAGEPVAALLKDALARFGKAEQGLKDLIHATN